MYIPSLWAPFLYSCMSTFRKRDFIRRFLYHARVFLYSSPRHLALLCFELVSRGCSIGESTGRRSWPSSVQWERGTGGDTFFSNQSKLERRADRLHCRVSGTRALEKLFYRGWFGPRKQRAVAFLSPEKRHTLTFSLDYWETWDIRSSA